MMPLAPDRPHAKQTGFTLIEVLIAMFITAIVGLMAFSGLDTAVNAIERNKEQSAQLDNLNRLFSVLGRDLRHTVSRTIRDENGETQAAFILNDEPRLSFTRAAWFNPREKQIKRSEVQRLEYRVEENKLYRRTWYSLDRSDEDSMVEAILIEGVTNISYQVLWQSPAGASSGSSSKGLGGTWFNSWPNTSLSTGLDTLPFAIKIKIELEGLGEIERLYELNHGS